MRLCLDTNAYSALAGGVPSVLGILENAEEIHVPTTVLGELYSGFQLGTLLEKNLKELDLFLSSPGVFIKNINREVSFRYGFLVKMLKEQGTPIPTNDIWIAAVSLNEGSILLSRDKHFKCIKGLQVLGF
ncbi:MAG: type II toxin-antitoxin system VapC family toxin [Spirochaetales bacterium]|nr:type II toxin-antitoxin system VapC family toxin [Spirochaetales bacterium]